LVLCSKLADYSDISKSQRSRSQNNEIINYEMFYTLNQKGVHGNDANKKLGNQLIE